jgi:hypothetical protein
MALHLSEYIELLSLFCALAFYKWLKYFKLRPFVLLLTLISIIEICGANYRWFGITKNYIIYDYYLIITAPVYLWIFLNMLSFKGFLKTIYLVISSLIIIFLVLNFLFLQGQGVYTTYSHIMLEFIKGLLSLMIITKLFREDNFEIGIGNNPYFWICGSTILFAVSSIVLLGLQQFIVANKIEIDGKSIYRIIMPILNVVLYTSYCYAFYLCKKLTNKLLLQ